MSQIGSVACICVCEDIVCAVICIGVADIGAAAVVFIQCLGSSCPVGKKLTGIIQLFKSIGQGSLEIPGLG